MMKIQYAARSQHWQPRKQKKTTTTAMTSTRRAPGKKGEAALHVFVAAMHAGAQNNNECTTLSSDGDSQAPTV